jgi:acyl carrier protein
MNKEIKVQVVSLLLPKLERLGIEKKELTAGFDLVRSGFVNSLEFVELVTRLEKHFNIELDFENALESTDFTTLGGLIKTLEKQLNG